MAIEFSCSGCGRALRAPDGAGGRKSRCPDCGNVAEVPEAGSRLPEPVSAVAAGAGQNEPSPRAQNAKVAPNWTAIIVAGMIGVGVVSIVVVGVYGHRSNQQRAEERERLTRMVDEQIGAATMEAEAYDFDAAWRALDDAEKKLDGSLPSEEYFRDELNDKITAARSSLEPLQAEYRSKIDEGWILFEGKLMTSTQHQEILSEREKKAAEQARRLAEDRRRRQDELRRQREEETRRREAAEATSAGFKIVEFDTRVTDSNKVYVEVSWKLQLKNLTDRGQSYSAHVTFLDENDFLVHEDFELSLRLGAHQTETFSYKTMMSPDKWQEVSKQLVKVNRQ